MGLQTQKGSGIALVGNCVKRISGSLLPFTALPLPGSADVNIYDMPGVRESARGLKCGTAQSWRVIFKADASVKGLGVDP